MSSYVAGLLAEIGIGGLAALSVYVILVTGQLSLGNAGFMAIGAYVASALTVWAGWSLTPAVAVAGIASAVVGLSIGFPALRLRGIYLAMATLGFGELVRSLIMSSSATGGAEGLGGMQRIGLPPILAWLAATLIGVLLLQCTPFWRTMRGVDDDEVAAELVGIDITVVKVVAFGLGAGIAGVSGALFAHHSTFIEPGDFGFDRSIDAVIAVILGGSGVVAGPLAGAAIVAITPELLREFANWRFAVFGALLVLIMVFRRQGLLDRDLLRRIASQGRSNR